MTTTTVPRPWRDPALIAILLGSLALNTHRLGHSGLHYFDESFHAIVARNLLKHPLKPTLIDVPYLAYDPSHWGDNHVWLHKPILPLWTIAASYAAFGVNTTALRLPSALLATLAVALTFLIGRDLFDRPTGLIAATLQAICPAITTLVQGYLFSDHIDISLLFWVEVGVYFLIRAIRTGSSLDVLLVGVAQGLAYLSKSYLAALLTGLAATAWMLPKIGLISREGSKLRARHLLILIAATLATIAPWTIYCAVQFPVEFEHEHGYVFTHLGQGVENWGGPWDRLVFDYLIILYRGFYTPLIVAGVALLVPAMVAKKMPLWFLYAWLFGVLAPHAISATKTPSATLIAMPAGFLLIARLIAEGWRGRLRALAPWAAIATIMAIRPPIFGRFGRGYPDPPVFGGVMLQAGWVFEQLAMAAAVVLILELASRWISRLDDLAIRALKVAALSSTLILGAREIQATWALTDQGSEDRPFVTDLAGFARGRLPANAVLLFEDSNRGEHQLAMFLLDRTCYQLQGRPAEEVAREVGAAGGHPYVITSSPAAWPRIYTARTDPRSLYEWQAAGTIARPSIPDPDPKSQIGNF